MAEVKGGEKLEAALATLATKLAVPATLRVGFLENAKYPDGTPVAAVAAWNNYGTGSIPPRPFFSNMVAQKSPEWGKAIGRHLKENDFDAIKALDVAGEAIERQLRKSIIDTNAPPLARSTIERKGFEKPLIETTHMINSVGHDVSK